MVLGWLTLVALTQAVTPGDGMAWMIAPDIARGWQIEGQFHTDAYHVASFDPQFGAWSGRLAIEGERLLVWDPRLAVSLAPRLELNGDAMTSRGEDAGYHDPSRVGAGLRLRAGAPRAAVPADVTPALNIEGRQFVWAGEVGFNWTQLTELDVGGAVAAAVGQGRLMAGGSVAAYGCRDPWNTPLVAMDVTVGGGFRLTHRIWVSTGVGVNAPNVSPRLLSAAWWTFGVSLGAAEVFIADLQFRVSRGPYLDTGRGVRESLGHRVGGLRQPPGTDTPWVPPG